MRLCDYTPLALRTEKPNDVLRDNELMLYRLGHALLGITSEIAEVRDTTETPDLVEEYGDMFWYLNLGCAALNTSIDEIELIGYEGDALDPIDAIVIQQGIIADKLKRAIYYGKEFEYDDVLKALAKIKINLIIACEDIEENYEDVLDANIRKLSQRYPDLKFDAERAINRDLEKEKKALQG